MIATLPSFESDAIQSIAKTVFQNVWRRTLDLHGYAVLLAESSPNSRTQRSGMIELLNSMSQYSSTPFNIERLGRFDQQVSTRFHRDGAPHASLLILGYEPTKVVSRFFVADVNRCAQRHGMKINAYLKKYNPMLPLGESELKPDITELKWQHEREAIVVVNNSLFPDEHSDDVPLGLFHQGIIDLPDPTAKRVINSLGAMEVGEQSRLPVPADRLKQFLETDDLD